MKRRLSEVGSPAAELAKGLGTWDAALITVGSVIGTGIFITTADIARSLPHPGMILLVWLAGGFLTLAGALTYAELGGLFPKAGGMYHFLKEAYGPLWGFLYGWTCFFVIMSGGVAALAVGFGEYLGGFLPFFSTRNILFALPIGGWTWAVSGGQIAAALAILVLTSVNYFGLKEGTVLQNLLTVVKIGAIAAFVLLGFLVPARASWQPVLEAAGVNLLSAFGVGMIAALWTYDGWYGLTFSAGEMRNPARSLPLGLISGTLMVMALYFLLNLVYLRAIPVESMGSLSRIGESAADALFGQSGARLLSMVVVISTFGCLSSTILYSSRIYHPMAQDRLFFRSMAAIHPRHRTPSTSLWAQSLWAMLLALSGTYDQLYTYVVFAAVLFHTGTGAAVFVLRKKLPSRPRPYRVWGYPLVPALFILSSLMLVLNTVVERPIESLIGVSLVSLGLPAYFHWKRRSGK